MLTEHKYTADQDLLRLTTNALLLGEDDAFGRRVGTMFLKRIENIESSVGTPLPKRNMFHFIDTFHFIDSSIWSFSMREDHTD